ncbi:MAG: hypothetical protein L0Y36_06950, partial [Planctomycetales bacterium]|nr:hypothetical protein [Planctomycetales bacterium]
TWRIVSYDVQAYEAMWELSRELGLSPGCAADESVDDIVNADVLRQASVFGVLWLVFWSLYTGADGQDVLLEKSEHYQRRYERAVKGLSVQVDRDGDGEADETMRPGAVRIKRM